jgi:hypothetical protein
LVSFVLSSCHFSLTELDLSAFADRSLAFLVDSAGASLSDLDSSLQILALDSPSFSLRVTELDDETLALTLNDRPAVTISVVKLRERPALFRLALPLRYSRPDAERDGSHTLSAKFGSMALYAIRHPDAAPDIFRVVREFAASPELNIAEAAIRALRKALPVFVENCDRAAVAGLVSSIIFARDSRWHFCLNIVKVIKAIPRGYFDDLLGQGSFEMVLDVVIGFSVSSNEQLGAKSKRLLRQLTDERTFETITLAVVRRIDFFDEIEFPRLLRIAKAILVRFPRRSLDHLVGAVWGVRVSYTYCVVDPDR